MLLLLSALNEKVSQVYFQALSVGQNMFSEGVQCFKASILPLSLSLFLCLCLSLVSVCLSLSLCLCVCLCLSVSIFLFRLCLFLCAYTSLSHSPFVSVYMSVSVCLWLPLSVCLSVSGLFQAHCSPSGKVQKCYFSPF